MIELSHSKRQILGVTDKGLHRHRVISSLQALQMRTYVSSPTLELEGAWQDIDPRFVYSNDKWISEGTPYLIEFDASCGRKIYPDRSDLSKYINIPAIPIFSALPKSYETERIVASNTAYDVIFGLHNTKLTFQILIRNPIVFDRITFDVDSAGYDIASLLESKSGIGIPHPRLIDAEGTERLLKWSLNAGQLELGFDLTGLKFPVELSNVTVDVDVTANADDDYRQGSSSYWSNSTVICVLGHFTGSDYDNGGSQRFLGVNIPAGSTINSADVTVQSWSGYSSTVCRLRVRCADEFSPPQNASQATYDARWAAGTSQVDWTPGAWVADGWYTTPDISTPVQEVINNNGGCGAMMVFIDDHDGRSDSSAFRGHGLHDGSKGPPNLQIDYDPPSGGGGGGWAAGASRLLV